MLKSIIKEPDKIIEKEKTEMFLLMHSYYKNVTEENFYNDLSKKDKIIMLMEEEVLCGFSTQVLLKRTINNKKTNIVFSGDTIIDKQHNNSFALPIAWGKMMFSILNENPTIPLYWLLTSKGYKTYRYLPVFFNNYFPKPFIKLTSFEKKLLLCVGQELFEEKLDTQRWILKAGAKDQHLRPGVADITESKRTKQEIVYFEKKNPGYMHGDELICLARFSENNIKPFISKKILAL